MMNLAESPKPLFWIKRSLKDIQSFPDAVKKTMGFALWQAQLGERHPDVKTLKGFGGSGVLEVVEDHDGNTYRAVYTVKYAGVVYVLHAFQKKSKSGIKTPIHEIDLIRKRLKLAEQAYADWKAQQPSEPTSE